MLTSPFVVAHIHVLLYLSGTPQQLFDELSNGEKRRTLLLGWRGRSYQAIIAPQPLHNIMNAPGTFDQAQRIRWRRGNVNMDTGRRQHRDTRSRSVLFSLRLLMRWHGSSRCRYECVSC